MKWPGQAAVEVALVTIAKQKWSGTFTLNGKTVPQITAYLDESEDIGNPYVLEANADKSFVGSYVLGKGFVLEPDEARRITDADPRYHDVIFPYLNGDDLNNNPDQSPSRYVINFFDWPLRRYTESEWRALDEATRERMSRRIREGSFEPIAPPMHKHQVAADYPVCLDIVERLVKPERDKINRDVRRERWWHYGERAPGLYRAISRLQTVFAVPLTAKYLSFVPFEKHHVFTHALAVIADGSKAFLSQLTCSFSEVWAWKNSSTMGGSTLRYTPSDCFETFPFLPDLTAEQEAELERIGEQYHEHRRQLMLGIQLGLTKTYNLFHSQPLRPATPDELVLEDKPFEKLLGNQAAHLRKHLLRTPEATLSFSEAVAGIEQLRRLHVQMDTAVLNAYGWQDMALGHAFHEVDYLPENDRIRYTISPTARKEVLKRLLLLNHDLYAQEQAAKAAQTAANPKGRTAKIKSVPRASGPATPVGVAEPASPYASAATRTEQDLRILTTPLFAAAAQMEVREQSRVTLQSADGQTTLRLKPVKGAQKGQFDNNYQIIDLSGELAQALLGRREGQQIEFKGKVYQIKSVG